MIIKMLFKMKVQKLRDVKTPNRGTSVSAGIDFYVPEDFETQVLKPGQSVLIPSGIKAQVPRGYALIAFNKSGVATKQGLSVGACVVDEDYEGEIHLHMINTSDKDQTVATGQKLVQFVLMPVSYIDVEEVAELPNRNTERGSGGFGSTGL
jgi:dUTP pyrophosphatase